jgi:hypothetical protein
MQAGGKRFSLSTGRMFIADGLRGGSLTPARSRDCSSSHCGSRNRLLVDGAEPGSIHWLVRLIICKGVQPWNGLDV